MSPTINIKEREICCKLVYYGPSLSGKTTNICYLHQLTPNENKGKLQCVDTLGDRTLFFDHFSMDLGEIQGMRVRFQIYGVPGQSQYKLTRKMVLNGVDGVVFIADSGEDRLHANLNSLEDLQDLLSEHGYDDRELPVTLQYNKRDLESVSSIEAMQELLNPTNKLPYFEAVATSGTGVIESFKSVCGQVIERIKKNMAPSAMSTLGRRTLRKDA